MANQQVLQAADGATDVAITLDMTRQAFGGGGSGYVPEGHYAVVGKRAVVESQKGGKEGKNLHISWEVVAPEEFAGIPIETYHPIPVGDPATEDYQNRENNLLSLVASYFSGIGKLEEIRQRKDAQLTPEWITTPGEDGKPKRFFILSGEGEYKGRKRAEVAFYIDAKEFADRPGPKKGAPPKTKEAAGKGASSSGGTPDLMGGSTGGNGAQSSGGAPSGGGGSKADVNKALGL